MTQIHSALPGAGFNQPEGIVSAQICTLTGHIAGPNCTSRSTEIFADGHLPSACPGHSGGATICADSGLLANQYCPNKSTIYNAMSPEEKEGNWVTSGYSGGNIPTATCNIHSAPAAAPTPAPEKQENKPTNNNTPKPDPKPDTKPTNNTPSQQETNTTPKPSTSSTNTTNTTTP